MEIRTILKKERESVIKLIWETFLMFEAPDYSEEGIETFRLFIFNDDLFENTEFFAAFDGKVMKGIIATRDNRKHISCFFVYAEYQKQGIGRKLWDYVRDNSCASLITVNSSPFAVPIYRRLGFTTLDTERLTDGIRYTPMCFSKLR